MTFVAVHPDLELVPCLRGLDPAAVLLAYPDTALVYLLHLDTPFVVNGYAWQHYYGSARPGRLADRMIAHRLGHSNVRFLQLASAQGCTWHLARVWPGSYREEQRIKRMGGARRRCPSCGAVPNAERQKHRDALGHYVKPGRAS